MKKEYKITKRQSIFLIGFSILLLISLLNFISEFVMHLFLNIISYGKSNARIWVLAVYMIIIAAFLPLQRHLSKYEWMKRRQKIIQVILLIIILVSFILSISHHFIILQKYGVNRTIILGWSEPTFSQSTYFHIHTTKASLFAITQSFIDKNSLYDNGRPFYSFVPSWLTKLHLTIFFILFIIILLFFFSRKFDILELFIFSFSSFTILSSHFDGGPLAGPAVVGLAGLMSISAKNNQLKRFLLVFGTAVFIQIIFVYLAELSFLRLKSKLIASIITGSFYVILLLWKNNFNKEVKISLGISGIILLMFLQPFNFIILSAIMQESNSTSQIYLVTNTNNLQLTKLLEHEKVFSAYERLKINPFYNNAITPTNNSVLNVINFNDELPLFDKTLDEPFAKFRTHKNRLIIFRKKFNPETVNNYLLTVYALEQMNISKILFW